MHRLPHACVYIYHTNWFRWKCMQEYANICRQRHSVTAMHIRMLFDIRRHAYQKHVWNETHTYVPPCGGSPHVLSHSCVTSGRHAYRWISLRYAYMHICVCIYMYLSMYMCILRHLPFVQASHVNVSSGGGPSSTCL